jgi:hypothetical protein
MKIPEKLAWHELGDIVCFAMNNDPAGLLGVMPGDLLAGKHLV